MSVLFLLLLYEEQNCPTQCPQKPSHQERLRWYHPGRFFSENGFAAMVVAKSLDKSLFVHGSHGKSRKMTLKSVNLVYKESALSDFATAINTASTCLDEIEHIFYNLGEEKPHEKKYRFIEKQDRSKQHFV